MAEHRPPDFLARPMCQEDLASDFICSRDQERVTYFKNEAIAAQSSGDGRVFVVPRPESYDLAIGHLPPILGYYALVMSQIRLTDLGPVKDPKARSTMPAALLGQIARDDRVPKSWRLGEWMMADMFRRVLKVADEIGCGAIHLHAGEGLIQWYTKFGFRPIGHTRFPRSMFLAVATLRSSPALNPPTPKAPQ